METVLSVLIYHELYNSREFRRATHLFLTYILPIIFTLQLLFTLWPIFEQHHALLMAMVNADYSVIVARTVAATVRDSVPLPTLPVVSVGLTTRIRIRLRRSELVCVCVLVRVCASVCSCVCALPVFLPCACGPAGAAGRTDGPRWCNRLGHGLDGVHHGLLGPHRRGLCLYPYQV